MVGRLFDSAAQVSGVWALRYLALASRPAAVWWEEIFEDSSERADIALGRCVLIGFATGLMAYAALGITVGVVAAALISCSMVFRHRRARDAQRLALTRDVPLLVELLAVASAAGLNPYRSLETVSEVLDGPLSEQVRTAMARVRAAGVSVGESLRITGEETGVDSLRRLGRSIDSAERQGNPVAPELGRIAKEERDAQRRSAEAEARKAPVRILFPLTFCVLPSFVLLTVVPVFVETFRLIRL